MYLVQSPPVVMIWISTHHKNFIISIEEGYLLLFSFLFLENQQNTVRHVWLKTTLKYDVLTWRVNGNVHCEWEK